MPDDDVVRAAPQARRRLLTIKVRPRDDAPDQASLDPGGLERGDHDDLTGLWNRRRFEDELDCTPRDGERRALLCIDVDGYREVIQRHGPHAAEGVIRSISYALAQRLRPHAALARTGGDGFAAVLPGMTPHLLRSLADDLCTACTTSYIPPVPVACTPPSASVARSLTRGRRRTTTRWPPSTQPSITRRSQAVTAPSCTTPRTARRRAREAQPEGEWAVRRDCGRAGECRVIGMFTSWGCSSGFY